LREVREEPSVQTAVDAAYLRWPRADEAWQTVVWAIARDPFGAGPPLTESGMTRLVVFDGARSIGMPSVRAVYVVEPATVIVREVLFQEAVHLYAGNA
jgi:hypothetical protein